MRAALAHALGWVKPDFLRLVARHPDEVTAAIELASCASVATIELASHVTHLDLGWQFDVVPLHARVADIAVFSGVDFFAVTADADFFSHDSSHSPHRIGS